MLPEPSDKDFKQAGLAESLVELPPFGDTLRVRCAARDALLPFPYPLTGTFGGDDIPQWDDFHVG